MATGELAGLPPICRVFSLRLTTTSGIRNLFITEAHIEYHLKGLLSNKIPLLRQAQWYLLFGGNAFYAGQNFYYTEAFIGIDNIGYKVIRGLRVDFVQSWDSYRAIIQVSVLGLPFRSYR